MDNIYSFIQHIIRYLYIFPYVEFLLKKQTHKQHLICFLLKIIMFVLCINI